MFQHTNIFVGGDNSVLSRSYKEMAKKLQNKEKFRNRGKKRRRRKRDKKETENTIGGWALYGEVGTVIFLIVGWLKNIKEQGCMLLRFKFFLVYIKSYSSFISKFIKIWKICNGQLKYFIEKFLFYSEMESSDRILCPGLHGTVGRKRQQMVATRSDICMKFGISRKQCKITKSFVLVN